MAMADYGAIVFKNGEFINKDCDLFMDMEQAVGWVDVKRVRYDDCDCIINPFDEPDPACDLSDCGRCPRAQGKDKDCRGNDIFSINFANGNFYAYIGNRHITFAFYKHFCSIYVDGKFDGDVFGCRDEALHKHRVLHLERAGVNFTIQEVAPRIYHLEAKIDGDFYHVIYGYGIDPSMRVWRRIKVLFLGKKVAKTVDKLIARFWKK